MEHLAGCGEDFAIYSEMRSHWRILNRGVSQTNLCFQKISPAAVWKLIQDSKHGRRRPIRYLLTVIQAGGDGDRDQRGSS